MTFEAPVIGSEAVPEGWRTFGQLTEHPALQGLRPHEVRDTARYLADNMTTDVEDPSAAKSELVGLFQQTGEESSAPRPVIAYRPDLARAVIEFFEEQTERVKSVDAAIEEVNIGIVEALAAGLDTEGTLARIKATRNK